MTFSGAWVARNQVNQPAPLVPGLDPQHLNPDQSPDFIGTSPSWVSSAPAPDLPVALLDPAPAPLATGIGPVDRVDYQDTLAGIGYGHGLTELESLDSRSSANMTDDGTYAARMYTAPRIPGVTYGADLFFDQVDQGDSPETVALQRTGVGVPTDPEARHPRRLQRTQDGTIDDHRWDVAFRPLRPMYAKPTAVQDNPGGNQLSQSTPSVIGYNPSSPDRFVQSLVRRVPGDWSQPFSSDGTQAALTGAVGAYGLPSWGL